MVAHVIVTLPSVIEITGLATVTGSEPEPPDSEPEPEPPESTDVSAFQVIEPSGATDAT